MFFNAQGRILEPRTMPPPAPGSPRLLSSLFSAGACFLVSESPARIGRDNLVSTPYARQDTLEVRTKLGTQAGSPAPGAAGPRPLCAPRARVRSRRGSRRAAGIPSAAEGPDGPRGSEATNQACARRSRLT